MPIFLTEIQTESEPAASTKTPPVQNLAVHVPVSQSAFGLYAIAQNERTGQVWNRADQAFQQASLSKWADCAFKLFYRGNNLFGRFVGADELPAGIDIFFVAYSMHSTETKGVPSRNYDIERARTSSDSPWPTALPGTVAVDHDTGGIDQFRVVDVGNNSVESVSITAYLASDFAAHGVAATVRGRAVTDGNGRWINPIRLLPNTAYTLHFAKDGLSFGPLNLTTGAAS